VDISSLAAALVLAMADFTLCRQVNADSSDILLQKNSTLQMGILYSTMLRKNAFGHQTEIIPDLAA